MVTISVKADTAAATPAHWWGWLLALAIVQIIAGSIAIAVPVVASLAAVAIFGAVLIVTATLQLIHAFQIRVWPRSAWYGLSGVLYAIGGILVVVYPLGGCTDACSVDRNRAHCRRRPACGLRDGRQTA